jgi:hypothetical protein
MYYDYVTKRNGEQNYSTPRAEHVRHVRGNNIRNVSGDLSKM